MKKITFFVLFSLFVFMLNAQGHWSIVDEQLLSNQVEDSREKASDYQTLKINKSEVLSTLASAPHDDVTNIANSPVALGIVMPEGTFQKFRLVEYDAVHPDLQAKYPQLRAFKGYSENGDQMRCDFSYNGFNATIQTSKGLVIIDRYYDAGQDFYTSYYQNNLPVNGEAWSCEVHTDYDSPLEEQNEIDVPDENGHELLVPDQPLRLYQCAITTTGEWTFTKGGGTVAGALAELMNIINQLNMMMERDFTVRLQLVADNDQLIFLDANDDPFMNGSPPDLTSKAHGVISGLIGNVFDIGHAFGTNTGGLAGLGVVCGNDSGRGSSSTFGQYSGSRFFHIVGHEMGHQMSCTHTFNLCDGDNETPDTGYEPGAGITIMSYSGASNCDAQWNADHSDPYYHVNSIERNINFVRSGQGNNCGDNISIDNSAPTVNITVEGGFFIPIETPFYLEAEATDPDGDDITYNFEQYDLGPFSIYGEPMGDAPSFRSLEPDEDPFRYFPNFSRILSGTNHKSEVLPGESRNFTFRCTARDNNPEGGLVDWDEIKFKSHGSSGPFIVTGPEEGAEVEAGSFTEVNWDVANTNNNPVNCQLVDIYYSSNGTTFDIVALNKPNIGTAFVLIPEVETPFGRILVRAADNIFLNVSGTFSVVSPENPGFSFAPMFMNLRGCLPTSVVFNLMTASQLGFGENINFEVINALPPLVQASFDPNMVTPGDATTLIVEFNQFADEITFPIEIRATSTDADTVYHTVEVRTVNSDFSNIALTTPTDGTSDLTTLPSFSWASSENAESYIFELASEPDFSEGNIIERTEGITGTDHVASQTLDENAIYYWRVRGVNECTEGKGNEIYSFKTLSISCEKYTADDTPINISASGTPEIESKIVVPFGSGIVDVNVPRVQIIHDFISDLRLTLISPEGTEVILIDQKCGNSGNIDQGYDDESANGFDCPLTDMLLHKPAGTLALIDTEDAEGLWTLRIKDFVAGGGGGQLNSWEIELCASLTVLGPELIVNNLLEVESFNSGVISSDLLTSTDENNSPDEIRYTITKNVEWGVVKRGPTDLEVGDSFTQQNIDNGDMLYISFFTNSDVDDFNFTVVDGEGGYIGGQTFNISIDNIVANENEVLSSKYALFPNPTSDFLTIKRETSGAAQIKLFSQTGSQIDGWKMNSSSKTINLSELPSGLYFMSIETLEGSFTEKIIKH